MGEGPSCSPLAQEAINASRIIGSLITMDEMEKDHCDCS